MPVDRPLALVLPIFPTCSIDFLSFSCAIVLEMMNQFISDNLKLISSLNRCNVHLSIAFDYNYISSDSNNTNTPCRDQKQDHTQLEL